MKHTQENWEVKRYPSLGYPFFIASEYTSSHVALIGLPTESDNNEEEAEANANLIAAAPELLAALQTLLREARQNSFSLTGSINDTAAEAKAEAAINKALNKPINNL